MITTAEGLVNVPRAAGFEPASQSANDVISAEYRIKFGDPIYWRKIRQKLDSSGLACLEDFLHADAVARLQSEILELESQASEARLEKIENIA